MEAIAVAVAAGDRHFLRRATPSSRKTVRFARHPSHRLALAHRKHLGSTIGCQHSGRLNPAQGPTAAQDRVNHLARCYPLPRRSEVPLEAALRTEELSRMAFAAGVVSDI